MTIKELYEYALEKKCENTEIILQFSCEDDCYSGDTKLVKELIDFKRKQKKTFLRNE